MPGYSTEFGNSLAAINLANILKHNHPKCHRPVSRYLNKYFTELKLIHDCIVKINPVLVKNLIRLLSCDLKVKIMNNTWPEVVKTHVFCVASTTKRKYLSKEINNG